MAEPLAEGALVTLTVDPSLPLESRIELLSYAFTRAVNSDALQKVIEWDITNGVVRFVLAPKGLGRLPRGTIAHTLEDLGVAITFEQGA